MRSATLLLVTLAGLAGCPSPKPAVTTAPGRAGDTAETDVHRRKRLVAELQDEILASYERDDPPEFDTDMIEADVGPARIGAGPGDVLYGEEVLQRASSRWPLRIDPDTPTEVRSKHLDIHLAADPDISAAWMSDEVSWRISVCGRWAAIPLRITALYAHDGDRWVEVFEHLSFGRVPRPDPGGKLVGRELAPKVEPGSLGDALAKALAPILAHDPAAMRGVVSLDIHHNADADPAQLAPTLLLAPDPESEWHGDQDLAGAQLVDGTLTAADRRIGTVALPDTPATIAYWIGNFIADLPPRQGMPGGKVRLRGTFVFEKRDDRWIVVQGHLSQPIYDNDLASIVFGTSLLSTREDLAHGLPLQVACDDGQDVITTPAQ